MSNYSAGYVYDIECVPNFFSCRVTRVEDGGKWCFEISDWKNQGQELYVFLTQLRMTRGRMIGYNNLAYDYPMLHTLIQYNGVINNAILYNKSQAIIASRDSENPREHFVWESDRYVDQVDLMLIHHFDNKAKITSLKLLQFNMRLNNIHELMLGWKRPYTRQECDETLIYNDSDVQATLEFYKYSLKAIEFRDQLTAKYGKDFTNHNDTRIGQDFFVMELAKHGVRANKNNQTYRTHINVGEIILPYIKFETPGFSEVLEFFRKTVINPEQIKGFFGSRDAGKTKCTANITAALADSMNPNDVTVYYMDGTRSKYSQSDCSKRVKYLRPVNIHTVVNGFRFDFGAGGIHGSVHNTIVVPRAGETLRDSDVASYYPNLSIENNLYPLHLGKTFCAVYKGIYEQRKTYKKGSVENNMLKLALNGVYGKSNDKHSPFYDPQYTMSITINGQLLLCMLAEQLMKIPGLRLVQINTDGLTYVCPDQYLNHVDAINEWWQKLTKLELEHVDYIKMAIRDVNSYLAVTKPYVDKDGVIKPPKIKRIGAYAYERAAENEGTRELPWHKDQGGIVIAKAAEAALVRGENIERFIRNHLSVDPLDFMFRTKVNRNDALVLETPVMWHDKVIMTKSEQMQHVTRFFVSKSGGQLFKIMSPTDKQKDKWNNAPHWRHKVTGQTKQASKAPSGMWLQCDKPGTVAPDRRIGIKSGCNVTVCNNLTGLEISDVDVSFYVKATRKLVDELLTG